MLTELPPAQASAARLRAWVLHPKDQSPFRIWGLTPEERLRRSLARAVPRACGRGGRQAEAPGEPPSSLFLRGDYVFDERLVQALVARPNTVLVDRRAAGGLPITTAVHVESGLSETGRRLIEAERLDPADAELIRLSVAGPEDLAPGYEAALRKSQPPLLLPARPERAAEIESRLFEASYKGVTDFVTRHVWPRPARAVTRWLAERGVSPNAVTAASAALVVAATALFAAGLFLPGLIAAWLMTFLDTVDGKLARVTLSSSRAGHVLDHGLDLLHPPFWYLAWAAGLAGGLAAHPLATAVTVAGYVVGRLLEGAFMLAFGIETHSWRPLDSAFRQVTARRNPNLVLLTPGAIAGRPDLGLAAVAVWTAVSIGFHTVRLAQALAARGRGEPIRPWYDEPAPAAAGGLAAGSQGGT